MQCIPGSVMTPLIRPTMQCALLQYLFLFWKVTGFHSYWQGTSMIKNKHHSQQGRSLTERFFSLWFSSPGSNGEKDGFFLPPISWGPQGFPPGLTFKLKCTSRNARQQRKFHRHKIPTTMKSNWEFCKGSMCYGFQRKEKHTIARVKL